MELYQLQSFIVVATAGSLSRAAEIRHISLPGISKHIKMLEESLGQALFIRNVKGMQLTGKGEQVLEHALRIQKEVEHLQALSEEVRPIRLGLNVSPGFLELSRLMKLVEDSYPAREILLTNMNTGDLLTKLTHRELDLCLAFGEIDKKFHQLLIRNVMMPLMIPTSKERKDLELNTECWIINSPDCPFRKPLTQFWKTHGFQPLSTIQAQDLSRKEIVAQGLGIGFLEPQDGLALVKSGLAKPYGSYQVAVALSMVFRDTAWMPLAERLKEYINARYDKMEPLQVNAEQTALHQHYS